MKGVRHRLLLGGFLLGLIEGQAGARLESAEDRRAEAQAQAERGAFEEAAQSWGRVAELARRAKDTGLLMDALLGQGAADQARGLQRLAVKALAEEVELARQGHDRRRLIAGLNLLGVAQTFSHAAEHAEGHLREAEKLAQQEGDPWLHASVLNNLGLLLAARGSYDEALSIYRRAIGPAEGAKDHSLLADLRGNLAEADLRKGDFAGAASENRKAEAEASAQDRSHAKAFALEHCGKMWESIFAEAPAHEQGLRLQALRAYLAAAEIAEGVGDQRALSFALGYTGHLYEQEKKWPEAMALTRRAAFLAQEIRSPGTLYLWEWQTGRIDRAEGRRDAAIADYRRAIVSLDQIRNDLSARLGNANARSSFREAAGDVFFELADLLLQRADGLHDEADIAGVLKEARDACETLKSVELEDYFQDDCVNLLRKKIKPIENLASKAAVLYLIPLRDRTEIIVSMNGHLERVKAPVAAVELIATVRAFRRHLETRTTEEYLEEAQKLYGWLIRPLEPLLKRGEIDTLVFIPDGALRTIPMAALYDGEKFLVQKYAIAVTPGLTLMEPKPSKRLAVSFMADGLTESVQRDGQQFAALPYVKGELDKIHQLYGGTTLMNGDFRVPMVEKAFGEHPYSIVHIASHGEFSGDVRKTFVLTYDDRLTMDGLERLIRPAQLREQPVELLTLSACQTAAGDDRAALGLAGVAIKAGARSAFATLWSVNDEASTTLISEFYTQLQRDPDLSKAKALQRAQVKLLTEPLTSHPALWAAYMIIGNWL